MKIFFDTNVLISAFITRHGFCAAVLAFVKENPEHEFVTSEVVLSELKDVLTQRFNYSRQEVGEVLDLLQGEKVYPDPKELPEILDLDPDDLKILASALEAKADVLLTGDQDLLTLGDAAKIKILDPRTLWDMVKK